MKKLFLLFIVLSSLFLLFSITLNNNERQDVFIGTLVEGKPINAESARVLADRDCMPNESYTTLTCTAIIQANGEIIKVRYTHPIDVPCLSRGDKVNIRMKDNSTTEIFRIGRPSMEH